MATIARNIGPIGRRWRMTVGVALLIVGVAGAALLVLLGADRGARLAVFAPFFGAAMGLLQARDHTCVMLAARGQCESGHAARVDSESAVEVVTSALSTRCM